MLRDGTAMVEVRAIDPALPMRDPSAPLLAVAPIPPSSGHGGAASAAPASAGVVATRAATAAITPATVAPANASIAGAAAVDVTPVSATAVSVQATAPALAPRSALFVQAGAFADPVNAERLAAKLRGGGYGKIFVRDDFIAGRRMYRVRIGPVPDVPEFDRIVAALEQAGVHDAHLALD
jgi:rare lipoprotein A